MTGKYRRIWLHRLDDISSTPVKQKANDVLYLLDKLVNYKGPVTEALNEATKQYAENPTKQRLAEVSRELLDKWQRDLTVESVGGILPGLSEPADGAKGTGEKGESVGGIHQGLSGPAAAAKSSLFESGTKKPDKQSKDRSEDKGTGDGGIGDAKKGEMRAVEGKADDQSDLLMTETQTQTSTNTEVPVSVTKATRKKAKPISSAEILKTMEQLFPDAAFRSGKVKRPAAGLYRWTQLVIRTMEKFYANLAVKAEGHFISKVNHPHIIVEKRGFLRIGQHSGV